MPELGLGIGLHRGGADAVLLDERSRILAHAKLACEEDERTTIGAAIRALDVTSDVEEASIGRAVLRSTAVDQALERRRGLHRVAVARVGRPLTLALPPLATWPEPLRSAISAGEAIVGGGAEYDGEMVAPLDGEALARFLATLAGAAEAVAITSVFSPVAPDHELAAAEIVRRELGPAIPVSLSHEIGTMGLLERENATVLNAALSGVAEGVVDNLREALEAEGIEADPFFAKGDGTVMTPEHAVRYPFQMLASGPASGMRGAAWLSGVHDAAVVEVAAQSTTIGALVGGLPRERATPHEIAGVRANFRVPDLLTLPYGVDVAVEGILGAALERVRSPDAPAALLVIGEAAELVRDHLDSVSDIIFPKHGGVAHAVGLLVAPAGGEADRICANRPGIRATTMEAARAEALARAIHAGAHPDHVEIVEVQEIPLTYVLEPAVRIRARAAGPPG
jgi:N-methylhydantoinase A/oxoprolinase/acetone carboxylase beta subunit